MSPLATWLLLISLIATFTIAGMWLTIDSMKRELHDYRNPF